MCPSVQQQQQQYRARIVARDCFSPSKMTRVSSHPAVHWVALTCLILSLAAVPTFTNAARVLVQQESVAGLATAVQQPTNCESYVNPKVSCAIAGIR